MSTLTPTKIDEAALTGRTEALTEKVRAEVENLGRLVRSAIELRNSSSTLFKGNNGNLKQIEERISHVNLEIQNLLSQGYSSSTPTLSNRG